MAGGSPWQRGAAKCRQRAAVWCKGLIVRCVPLPLPLPLLTTALTPSRLGALPWGGGPCRPCH